MQIPRYYTFALSRSLFDPGRALAGLRQDLVVSPGKSFLGTKDDQIKAFRTTTEQADLRILVFLQTQASQLILT